MGGRGLGEEGDVVHSKCMYLGTVNISIMLCVYSAIVSNDTDVGRR